VPVDLAGVDEHPLGQLGNLLVKARHQVVQGLPRGPHSSSAITPGHIEREKGK
jgi:hypothetical protein